MADLYDIHIRRAFENLLGSDQADPAQVINEFFICCYGEESGWPAALTEWRNEVLIDYGLSIDLIGDAPEAGSNRYSIDKGMYLQQTDVCEFKGEVSDELIVVFSSEPDLSGWNCTCGAVKSTNGGHSGGVELIGMAVFEKNGTRILVLMDRQKEQWNLWTLGTKALYQDPEMELSVLSDPSYASGFIIRYDCLDGIRMFHAGINDPTDDLRGHFALSDISGYQYVSADRQISHWINIDSNSGLWTYTQQGTDIQKESLEVAFSRWLGACDIAEFPDTAEKAHAVPEILPDGYAMTGNVHFRKDHSSRSKDLGTLQSGTIIRIKDTVPGDPFDWIQTSAGGKEGYVASNYTSAGSDSLHINTEYPLPVAMCRNTVRLRTGTGLFDAVADELPAGTKMHIIMNQGDWLYVVVPRGTISWFMDVDGIYGYIKKSDVRIAAMESCLDWQ
ncbi:MAG: SH3 domain-containing protein [Clostridia bacterium]|nr:SH3 domain-containing protein [Clostridia bacterium]